MSGKLRGAAAPFVAAVPAGARIRTRLRVTGEDAAVLRAAGSHLGSLAGRDLRVRSQEGRLDGNGQAVSRRERKRQLTALSSSRWAGAITRTTEDQVRLAERNLAAEQLSLKARIRRIEARLAVPAGGRKGRARGYATQAGRHGRQQRLEHLRHRLARAGQQRDAGLVSVCRGGRRLAGNRHNLEAAGLTQEQWRQRWEAGRLFLTADGEKDKHLGNETIRWHPQQAWLEVKLPAPLGHLANRPRGRYRLSCPVEFSYRGEEAAAQAESGAIRYDISYDPVKNRWYLDASWKTPQPPAPSLEELRQAPVLAADLNHGHLAAWIVTPDGNPQGPPVTVPLKLAGLPATQRDGRLRAAIGELIRIARQHGCRAISVEDLDFNEARAEGRERHGNRPSRGKRGKAFRRVVSGIPTARFRDRLTQMTSNQGLAVIAVDPAYTSRWGAEHWLAPLREQNTVLTTGHHAAAVVIGRRAQGRKARRRAGVTRPRPEDHGVRATPRAPRAKHAGRDSGTRQAPRQPPRWRKTVTADRERPPDQAAHDRSGPPDSQDHLLLSQLGTVARVPRILLFCAGVVVSLAASWLLVSRLERLGERAGFSEAWLGLVAALAADAPEITSAVTALSRGQASVGAGVVIGSNVFNLAALLGLAAVVAGRIGFHRRVVVLAGVPALWLGAVCLLTVAAVVPPAAGLALAAVVLVPYVAVLGMRRARLEGLRLPARWVRWLAAAVHEEEAELLEAIRPPRGTWRDAIAAAAALIAVVGASTVMEIAATALGRRYAVADIVTGGLVLAVVTSLPNAVSAVYLARRGRGAAVLSTALNSNAINVVAGLLIPACLAGLGPRSAPGMLVAAWYAGLTALALALAFRTRGLGRVSGAVIIAAYLAFVTALAITVAQGGLRPATAVFPAAVITAAGVLLLTWPPRAAAAVARCRAAVRTVPAASWPLAVRARRWFRG